MKKKYIHECSYVPGLVLCSLKTTEMSKTQALCPENLQTHQHELDQNKKELKYKVEKFYKRDTNTVLGSQKLGNRFNMMKGNQKRLQETKAWRSLLLSSRSHFQEGANLEFELRSSSFRIYVFKVYMTFTTSQKGKSMSINLENYCESSFVVSIIHQQLTVEDSRECELV